MKSGLYVCPRCGKDVISTSGLIRHVNICKIPIFLLYCQSSNSDLVLDYNMTKHLDLLSDTNKQGITPKVSNHGNLKRTKPAKIGNNKEGIRLADIHEQRPATPN